MCAHFSLTIKGLLVSRSKKVTIALRRGISFSRHCGGVAFHLVRPDGSMGSGTFSGRPSSVSTTVRSATANTRAPKARLRDHEKCVNAQRDADRKTRRGSYHNGRV